MAHAIFGVYLNRIPYMRFRFIWVPCIFISQIWWPWEPAQWPEILDSPFAVENVLVRDNLSQVKMFVITIN